MPTAWTGMICHRAIMVMTGTQASRSLGLCSHLGHAANMHAMYLRLYVADPVRVLAS